MKDWTRQEAITLSGLTRNQFEHLENKGLITPIKLGNPNRPTVIYSNTQLLAIRAYAKLRKEGLTMQALDKMPDNFLSPDKVSITKLVIAWEKKIEWIEDTPQSFYSSVFQNKNGKGKLLTTFSVKQLVDEMRSDFEKLGDDTIIDFNERLLEVA